MSHYDREFPRDRDSGDRNRQYQPRFYSNSHDHPHSDSRPRQSFQISRTQSQSNQPVARDYNPRSREYVPPPREMVNVPEFNREQLQHQKDIVLLATVPFDDTDISRHPLCDLLMKGVKNEENMLKSIEKLANVLGSANEFVADCPDTTSAAKKAENFRSDLDGRREFLESLDGTLINSIENFFKLPSPE
ncbi:hypothetical protein TRFO_23662 [Tritrichomonas foetus]|uniref:Uncharacterized protein n=1 Tax=Tritrichomonas foetus TaxID=1144522 RepID=A0A1J4KF78_9EUKA|nr:hypothetical protein TRFO_23662 [Tritrichomonas foetus]|eukprot:OHT08029.1 hypothetical protein TRFO_23662 [Tritrichomonas foetus]